MYYGSSPNFSSPQLLEADPLFVHPPSLTQYGYSAALPPLQLGNDLTLQSGSPAFGKGIDPSALSGLPSAIVSDLKNYIYVDINGKPRPPGGGSHLGAYQHQVELPLYRECAGVTPAPKERPTVSLHSNV